MNNAYTMALDADLLYACDARWWHVYRPQFRGLRVSQDEVPGVLHVPSRDRPGISLDSGYIHQGGNGGFQAMNLAVLMGAARILLLGFDMRSVDGRKHCHDDHGPGLVNPQESTFASWREAFRRAVPQLRDAGVTALNCTPGSALKCFPLARLEAAL